MTSSNNHLFVPSDPQQPVVTTGSGLGHGEQRGGGGEAGGGRAEGITVAQDSTSSSLQPATTSATSVDNHHPIASNDNDDHHLLAAEEHRRDAEDRLLFVFPELKDAFLSRQQQQQQPTHPSTDTMDQHQQQYRQTMTATTTTGVLWKRRDVFKNRWRPRWFALNPHQGLLTYYLLTTPTAVAAASNTTTTNTTSSSPTNRDRTTSWDSQLSGVSEHSVDYDVVPRGTIYLLGCTVLIDDGLSQSNNNLFAFTIRPPNRSDTNIHLAARTAANRAMWVEQIDRACRGCGVVVGPQPRAAATGVAPPPSARRTTTPPSGSSQARLAPPPPRSSNGSGGEPDHAATTPTPSSLPPQQYLQTPSERLNQQEHSIPEEEEDVGNEEEEEDTTAQLLLNVTDSSDNSALLPPSRWRSMGVADTLYDHVSEPLAARIQDMLQQHLPLCDHNNHDNDSATWKRIYHRLEDGHHHAAYQTNDGRGRRSMIKSVATLDHPPKQVLSLLLDISRRKEFETNIRTVDRMQTLNPHTFLDYYAYNAVWPTAAREFAVVTHWEVVGKRDNNDRGIAMISFSCPEADALKPPTPKHVRANLFVSMYLLRPESNRNDDRCHLTRLLSFDLAGGVSQHLSNVIITQQANLPAVVTEYLQRHEPVIENRFRGLLTNETVVATVINRLNSQGATSGGSHRMNGVGSVGGGGEHPLSLPQPDEDGDSIVSKQTLPSDHEPGIASQAIILFAPIILHRVLLLAAIPVSGLLFSVAVFLAVRQVALWHLGESESAGDEPALVGPVTCRFSVDLKGVLRFIANKREEREELGTGVADVSVVHIVASALARALQKEPALRRRRLKIPWLMIDTAVTSVTDQVDVSVSENGGGAVTLHGVEDLKVQTIADQVMSSEESTDQQTSDLGQCLVLSMSDYEESDIVMDAAPVHRDVAVVAVVGGVHLEKTAQTPRASGSKPRPVLSISLTMSGHPDIIKCKKFALDVQKFLQFPEMCDG